MRDTRIDDMKPGPELDAELAKALGMPNVRKYNYRYVWDNVGYVNGKPVGAVMGTIDVPEYSTTWDGLGEVIGEMEQQGWDYRIESYGSMKQVSFMKRLSGDYAEAHGEDVFLIGTLAAIKALQGEDTHL